VRAYVRACVRIVYMYTCIYEIYNKDFQATQVLPSLSNFCVKSEFEKHEQSYLKKKKKETKGKQIVIVNSRPLLFKAIYRI